MADEFSASCIKVEFDSEDEKVTSFRSCEKNCEKATKRVVNELDGMSTKCHETWFIPETCARDTRNFALQ